MRATRVESSVERQQHFRRELFAQHQFDLAGAQGFLDRIFALQARFVFARALGGGLGVALLGQRLGDGDAEKGHQPGEDGEGKERQHRREAEDEQQPAGDEKRAGIIAQLPQHGLVGGAARAALGHQQAGGERHDQRRNLRDEPVADREFGIDVGGGGEIEVMPRHADDNAAKNIDREDDQPGDGVAAHEFRRAVHRAEKRAFLLQFAAALLRLLVVDEASRKIGVDGHLLAGNGVEGESCADFGDARRALGDDQEIDGDEDDEHHEADDEIAAHHHARKAADDIAGRRHALRAMREDEARGGDVERQPQHGRDEKNGREGGKFQRLLDPQRDHQDQHRQGDGKGQPHVDHEGRNRQEENAQDRDDAEREADVSAAAFHWRDGSDRCVLRHGSP